MAVKEERFTYRGEDGETIAAFKWTGPAAPKAVIQIAHGAGEHSLRYLEPLIPIIEAGYAIYSADHRGHGLTAGTPERLGDFGPGGRAAAITDMAVLSKLIRERHPDLPLVLLGHSMGAGFAQSYILDHHALLDALVLSGTAAAAPPLAQGAAPARFSPNAGYKNPRTDYDWLSRDEKEVDKYIADPLCGIRFKPPPEGASPPMPRAYDPALMKRIRPDLPVYVFVGDEDPINAKLTRITP
ncbi:MAG TPA: alpha/beta fold hydrolase, partial [Caulobacterales bacterium]|nr:alpha/beta fold hydrolase [Caulobacterales bacterium]